MRELGFLLIYFQPALYCNVSDAWLFSERSRRLWVGFAGAYVELVLWALATLLWRLTDTDSIPNFGALVIMATTGAKLMINLNPLIKLDGYYLLSDYLGIPNLRQRSSEYLAARLRGRIPPGRPGRREARIYLAYGLLAASYSCALLTLVTVWFGRFLVSRYQGFGFVVFTGVVYAVFVRPRLRGRRVDAGPAMDPGQRPATPADEGASRAAEARAWLDEVRSRLMNDTENDVPLSQHMFAGRSPRLQIAPAPVHEPARREPAEPSRSPRRKGLAPRRLAWGAALAAAGLLLVVCHLGLSLSGEFKILPVEHVEVRTEVEGLIEHVAVDEGMEIAAGAPITQLSERDHRAALAKIAAEIDEKRAQLKLLLAGPRVEEIAIARTGVEKAGERSTYARLHLDMLESAPNLVARKEIDEAREQVAVRRKELDEARTRLDMLVAGSRPEEIEAAKAELAVLEADRARLEEELHLLAIASPIAGVVTTSKPREKVGQHVARGDVIADVHALRTVTAEIAVSEKDISDVRVGQPIVLKARAYPWTTFHGAVTSIAPVATKPDD
ncbi:MAG: HlyD family efflux transporter periplasmic adaptor subunit, partial [Deltaproteobacteria bacterium]